MRKWFILLGVLGAVVLLIGLWSIGFNPLALKQKAGLQVMTNNISASLFLNDQFLDKSPFVDKKIQPGSYILRIQPDEPGYASYELPIDLNKGMLTIVSWKPGETSETSGGIIYEMEKLSSKGEPQLAFETVPDGAIVTLDGGSQQFSPLLITNLTEGDHQFEVSLPSYQIQQHSVTLSKDHLISVTVILGKIPGELGVTESAQVAQPSPTAASPLSQIAGGPQVQILNTGFFVNNQEVLRVRATPSPNGRELGFAQVGQFYTYRGQTTDWLQIEFNDQSGWVSTQYSQLVGTDSAQTAE